MSSPGSREEDHDQLRRNTPKKIRVPSGLPGTSGALPKSGLTAKLALVNAEDHEFRPINTLKASKCGSQYSSSMDVFDEARCRSLDRRPLEVKSTFGSTFLFRSATKQTAPARLPHVDAFGSSQDLAFSEGFDKYRRQSPKALSLERSREARPTPHSGKDLVEVISDGEDSVGKSGQGTSSPLAAVQTLMYPDGGVVRQQGPKRRSLSTARADLASIRKQLSIESLQLGDELFVSEPSLGQSITLTLDDKLAYLVVDTDDGKSHAIEISYEAVDKVYVREDETLRLIVVLL